MQKTTKDSVTLDSLFRRQTNMKNYLLILTAFLSVTVAHGQTNVYHPFPDTNALWYQGHTYVSGVGVTCPQYFYLYGDTVISNKTYKKVLSDGYCYYVSNCCYHYYQYEGAIRQDTTQKKVYCYSTVWNKDTLLYDFGNLNLGDTLPPTLISNQSSNYVSSIDSVLVGATYRKQYHVSVIHPYCPLDSDYVQLIEGIGGTLGLFAGLGGSPMCGDNGGPFFTCYSENNIVLYTQPNSFLNCSLAMHVIEDKNTSTSISVYPNPFFALTTMYTDKVLKNASLTVYNSVGQTVKRIDGLAGQIIIFQRDDLPSGLYFIRLTQDENIFSSGKFVITDK